MFGQAFIRASGYYLSVCILAHWLEGSLAAIDIVLLLSIEMSVLNKLPSARPADNLQLLRATREDVLPSV